LFKNESHVLIKLGIIYHAQLDDLGLKLFAEQYFDNIQMIQMMTTTGFVRLQLTNDDIGRRELKIQVESGDVIYEQSSRAHR
jgi:hypothetical protein